MNIIIKDLYAEELLLNSKAIQYEVLIPRDKYADELLAQNNRKDAQQLLLNKEIPEKQKIADNK